MTQRKHKSGKPGNRPGSSSGRGSQHADRQGKFSTSKGSFKAPEDTHGGGQKEPRRRGDNNHPSNTGQRFRRDGNREENRSDFQRDPSRANRPRSGGPGQHESRRSDDHNNDFIPKSRNDQRPGGPYWLFGQHPVMEAIANPERKIHRLLRATGMDREVPENTSTDRPLPLWESIDRQSLDQLLPEGAVHQGIAARVSPLPDIDLLDVCEMAKDRDEAMVMVLDQVTDPHNVGAILRSAAAFGALAVILTERHAAPESGTLAKSASGALEHVPLIRVGNLARAMEQLKSAGFWLAGLAAEGKTTLAGAKLTGKVGLVMGAEGPGLRRLTREHCDLLVRLPTGGAINHLNVSNAAAVALYELVRARP